MGGAPRRAAGVRAGDGPERPPPSRRRVGRVLPRGPGSTVTEMLDERWRRDPRALDCRRERGDEPNPDLNHVRRCLAACELLVVQDIFPSETSRFAHVVLPAAASVEKAGTFTNTERRVQRFDAAVMAPGEARPDWRSSRRWRAA